MKKSLVFCLLVGSPVFDAAVRERVQAVVTDNNANVEQIPEKNILDCRELTVPGVEAVFLAKEQYGENFVLLNDGQN